MTMRVAPRKFETMREELSARAALVAGRINKRYHAIAAAVPPARPALCCWLESDASESLCFPHAVEARGREFDFAKPLDPYRPFYRRTDLEHAFHDGIGASRDGEAEHSEQCATCGRTLSYILTDWGVEQELTYWLDNPVARLDPETVYALDRLCVNTWAGMKRRNLIELAIVVGQAFRLLRNVQHDGMLHG